MVLAKYSLIKQSLNRLLHYYSVFDTTTTLNLQLCKLSASLMLFTIMMVYYTNIINKSVMHITLQVLHYGMSINVKSNL